MQRKFKPLFLDDYSNNKHLPKYIQIYIILEFNTENLQNIQVYIYQNQMCSVRKELWASNEGVHKYKNNFPKKSSLKNV